MSPLGAVGALFGMFLGWRFVRWFDRDEQMQDRMGISAKVWKIGKAKVRATRGDPWERAFRRMAGVTEWVEKRINRSEAK